jgi:tRNA U34 5-methylaminomethyl-2-thiouridine-forming methyltransferase MnmC
MDLRLIVTKDGSHSVEAAGGVTYHSVYGALRESRHIFIGAGLRAVDGVDQTRGAERSERACEAEGSGVLRIFEMGFGTGLNALLTLMEMTDRPVIYETVERQPLPMEMASQLNYCRLLGRADLQAIFERLHMAPWGQEVEIVPGFRLLKVAGDGTAHRMRQAADLVYYDAFDPVLQPEMWGEDVFRRIFGGMRPEGVLVTYCCKGAVRRAMEAAGFRTEKLPGPPGKREILRATKTSSSLPHPSHP